MAYSEILAQRLTKILETKKGISNRKMFGGLCYMLNGNMLCGIVDDKLMARVGPEQYDNALKHEYCTEMDFTGKPLKGMVYVLPEGIESKRSLKKWIDMCIAFASILPKKK